MLRGDKRLVIHAAASAQKAADHILGTEPHPHADTAAQKHDEPQKQIAAPESAAPPSDDLKPIQPELF